MGKGMCNRDKEGKRNKQNGAKLIADPFFFPLNCTVLLQPRKIFRFSDVIKMARAKFRTNPSK